MNVARSLRTTLGSRLLKLLVLATTVGVFLLIDHQLVEQRQQEAARAPSTQPPPCQFIDLRDSGFSMHRVSAQPNYKFDLGAAGLAAPMLQALIANTGNSNTHQIPSALGIAVTAAADAPLELKASRDRAAFEGYDSVCDIIAGHDPRMYCAQSEVNAVMKRLAGDKKGILELLTSTPACASADEQCWIDFRFRSWYGLSHDEFIDQVAMACRSKPIQVIDAWCTTYDPIAEQDLRFDFAGRYFNERGDQAQPLAAQFCLQGLLRYPGDDCTPVDGLILGRRQIGNSCELLIRTDAEKYVSQRTAWAGSWESNSEIWVPDTNLYFNVLKIEFLQAQTDLPETPERETRLREPFHRFVPSSQ